MSSRTRVVRYPSGAAAREAILTGMGKNYLEVESRLAGEWRRNLAIAQGMQRQSWPGPDRREITPPATLPRAIRRGDAEGRVNS